MDHKKSEIIKAAEHCTTCGRCISCPLEMEDCVEACMTIFAHMIVSDHPHTCYTCVHYGDGATCAKLDCAAEKDKWEYNEG